MYEEEKEKAHEVHSQLRDIRSQLGEYKASLKSEYFEVGTLEDVNSALKDFHILLQRYEIWRIVFNYQGKTHFVEKYLMPVLASYGEISDEITFAVISILSMLTKPLEEFGANPDIQLPPGVADGGKEGEEPNPNNPAAAPAIPPDPAENPFYIDPKIALSHLQEVKDICSNRRFLRNLVSTWIQNCSTEEDQEHTLLAEDAGSRFRFTIMLLLRNLVSIPDPRPGDLGHTAARQRMQIEYVRALNEESAFDVLLFWSEKVGSSTVGAVVENPDEEIVTLVWLLHGIVVKLCSVISPSELAEIEEKKKVDLEEIQENMMRTKAKVVGQARGQHGYGNELRAMNFYKDTKNRLQDRAKKNCGRTTIEKHFADVKKSKKQTLAHNVDFVDLAAGSTEQHDVQNTLLREHNKHKEGLGVTAIKGLREFFERFVALNATNAIAEHVLHQLKLYKDALAFGREPDARFSKHAKLDFLNFVAWFLEHQYREFEQKKIHEKDKAKLLIDFEPFREIISPDTMTYTSNVIADEVPKLKKHKESYRFVVAIRAAVEQMKMLLIAFEHGDGETKLVAERIVRGEVCNIPFHLMRVIREFVMNRDPRLLTYSVEGIHLCFKLMETIQKGGREEQVQFTVQIKNGYKAYRIEDFVNELAEGRVIDNLFVILESPSTNEVMMNYTTRLMHRILKVHPSYVCIFFQLSYLVRVQRLLEKFEILREKSKKSGVLCLQYIIRQFFQTLQENPNLVTELLYPRLKDRKANLRTVKAEWECIQHNYKNEFGKEKFRDFERDIELQYMRSELQRMKQRGAKASAPMWTVSEDTILKMNFSTVDPEMRLERLIMLLPEIQGYNRTREDVKQRCIDLGLMEPDLVMEHVLRRYLMQGGAEARQQLERLSTLLRTLTPGGIGIEVEDQSRNPALRDVFLTLKGKKHAGYWVLSGPTCEVREKFDATRLQLYAELPNPYEIQEDEDDEDEFPHRLSENEEARGVDVKVEAHAAAPGENKDQNNGQGDRSRGKKKKRDKLRVKMEPGEGEAKGGAESAGDANDEVLHKLFGDTNPGGEEKEEQQGIGTNNEPSLEELFGDIPTGGDVKQEQGIDDPTSTHDESLEELFGADTPGGRENDRSMMNTPRSRNHVSDTQASKAMDELFGPTPAGPTREERGANEDEEKAPRPRREVKEEPISPRVSSRPHPSAGKGKSVASEKKTPASQVQVKEEIGDSQLEANFERFLDREGLERSFFQSSPHVSSQGGSGVKEEVRDSQVEIKFERFLEREGLHRSLFQPSQASGGTVKEEIGDSQLEVNFQKFLEKEGLTRTMFQEIEGTPGPGTEGRLKEKEEGEGDKRESSRANANKRGAARGSSGNDAHVSASKVNKAQPEHEEVPDDELEACFERFLENEGYFPKGSAAQAQVARDERRRKAEEEKNPKKEHPSSSLKEEVRDSQLENQFREFLGTDQGCGLEGTPHEYSQHSTSTQVRVKVEIPDSQIEDHFAHFIEKQGYGGESSSTKRVRK